MSVTPVICINYRKAQKPFGNPKAKIISLKVF